MLDPHENAKQQLDTVASLIGKKYQDKKRFKKAIAALKEPQHFFETELIVEMDSGKKEKFRAFRSQHNNARGPFKGGIRFHHNVTAEEVKALSTWMTWKCAVTGIPYGGGKGGVIVNPKELSENELQRLSRAYAQFLSDKVGPWLDIPAPDVNTNGQIMAWMIDELEEGADTQKKASENIAATFTGKPIAIGGSEGREEATGLGGVYVLEQLVEQLGFERKKDVTIAIQGFGNVGYWFAHHADQLGYKIVAVSGSSGGVYVEDGLDPVKTLECKQETGSLEKCLCVDGVCNISNGKKITNEELLELDVDILVPSALENVITKDNANKIKAKAIIEMANGPITPEADAILKKKDIVVIPDILANAGGVTVSYFEWVQNLHGYYWSHEEVLSKLQPLMEKAFARTWKLMQEENLSGRMAAYSHAVASVIDAMMLKGKV